MFFALFFRLSAFYSDNDSGGLPCFIIKDLPLTPDIDDIDVLKFGG